ncbi:MAG: DUF2339 domain-containing protein [Rhodobacteraceae bacterium]|nr:DUF2339 domain-containing protein [Paracoccaceae bacterium]
MSDVIYALILAAIGYLLFSNHRLKKQISEIQWKLQQLAASTPPVADTTEKPLSPGQALEMEMADPTVSQPADISKVGPWVNADKSEDAPAKPEQDPPAPRLTAFVFKPENWIKARDWLMQNWFLAVAALSLALAGVFLVQYGVENGLLSPFWRVMASAGLGVCLIMGGEFVRRRWGDHDGDHTAYLASTFAGAGLVALFAAVLSARQLYGLIGPEAALGYLVLVSAVAVVLGWYYGAFLAVVGIVGSVAAPFLVGGESEATHIFFYYFALVVIVALLVDAIKRWAWVSALGLILSFGAAWAVYDQGAEAAHYLAFGLIASVAAMVLPRLAIWPDHPGTMVSVGLIGLLRRSKFRDGQVEFPTRLAAGAFVAAGAVAMLVAVDDAGVSEVWLAVLMMAALFLMVTLWARDAPALSDLAVLPPVLFIAVIVVQALDRGGLFGELQAGFVREPESAPPIGVSVLVGIGLAGSAIAHWRGLFPGRLVQAWSAGAALFAPLVLVTLEFWWSPVPVLGAGRWAAHGIIIAAVLVLFAGQVARRDGEDKRRVAYYALGAMTMIAFALVIMLSETALTLAMAVMVLGATVIDRRLNLPLLSVFVQVGVIVIGWRLVINPGIFWAEGAPLWEVLLAYLGSAVLLGGAWLLLAERGRDKARLTVESGIWAILGLLASVLLNRGLGSDFGSHWGVSLFGSVWLMLMLVQIYRMQAGGWMRWIRIILAVIYGLMATLAFAIAASFFNPLLSRGASVIGPPVFDSLLVALGVPALILVVGVWRMPRLSRFLRMAFIALSGMFAVLYLALEIRRFWRGDDLSVPGISEPELYTYTLALLLASAGLLFVAFSRRSLALRQIATIGIALTIAKVFLVDMAELAGLFRVASFLGLGLSLAGLGWIYRRMAAQWERVEPEG